MPESWDNGTFIRKPVFLWDRADYIRFIAQAQTCPEHGTYYGVACLSCHERLRLLAKHLPGIRAKAEQAWKEQL